MAPKSTATTVAEPTTTTDEPLILIAAEPPAAAEAAPMAITTAAPPTVTDQADPPAAPAAVSAAPTAINQAAEPLDTTPEPPAASAAPTVTVVTPSVAPETAAPATATTEPRQATTYTVRENEVILTGRVVQRGDKDGKKGQSGRYTRLHKGGEWLEHRIIIDEEVAPGIITSTQIPIVIPRGHATLAKSLRSGNVLQIRGRLDLDTEFDTRYGKQTAQHGTIQQRMFIKVGDVTELDASATPRQQAIMRVSGTVQAVVRVNETLGRHDTQRFHLVRLKVVERYPRQAPARGTFVYEQTMQVAVPADDPEMLHTILKRDNPVAVELAYREALDWASDNHHSLQGIAEEDRDRLRKQTRSYLIATMVAPLDGATTLAAADVETMLETVQKRQQTARRRRRQPNGTANRPASVSAPTTA